MPPGEAADPALNLALQANLGRLDEEALRGRYREQGSFVYVPDFLPQDFTAKLIAAVDAVKPVVNRNFPAGPQTGRQRQPSQH